MGEATVKTLASRLSSGLRQYGVAISLCLFALILYLVWQYHASIGWSYIWVMFIGGAVGAIELLGRYLYAPLRAISTTSGWIYILVNVGAAAAAYYMIGPNGFDIFPATKSAAGTESASLSDLKSILLAGFGALAFMRSSLFKFRVGDNEIGIGPAAILDTLLMVADRGVDRQEAIWRAQEVTDVLARVGDPAKGVNLLSAYCLALMQNIAPEVRQKIQDSAASIAKDDKIDPAIRLDLIALQLSNLVGSTVLEAAVQALGNRLAMPGKEPAPPAAAATASIQSQLANEIERGAPAAAPVPDTTPPKPRSPQ